MRKPIIVIDLDNVLSESAEGFIEFSNQYFGTSLTIADYSEDWQTMWGVTYAEAERRARVMHKHQIQRGYRPVLGAKEVVATLKEQYDLTVLTSRRKESAAVTKDWLHQYYPGLFDGVVFSGFFEAGKVRNGHLLTKGEQYEELRAQYVIDDHFKHCESALVAPAEAILFGSYPWNQHIDLPTGITRCRNWLAVKEYFDGRDGRKG